MFGHICQHNIKFVLTFTKNDLTLVETYIIIALKFGSDIYQIKVGIVQVNTKSGQKMTVISCSELVTPVSNGMIVICKYFQTC